MGMVRMNTVYIKKESEKMAILNEQWKHEGICILCRRYSYCKTQCKANKIKARKMIDGPVYDYFLLRNMFGKHADRIKREETP